MSLATCNGGQRWRNGPLAEHLSLRVALPLTFAAFLLTACNGALFTLANAPTRLSSVRVQTNVAYADQPRQRLDIYTPPSARAVPVVIFWYGGGWTDGTKENYRFVGTTLAESGFVAVLPDYRLYPSATFPAFVEDGARAVAWVERYAETFGGDHTRIVLMGHSAGAHEAAMLALAPKCLAAAGATSADIVGLIGLSGPYVLEPDTQVLRTIFSSPYGRSDWQPLHYVHSHAPPTLLLHGLEDQRVLPVQTRQFRDALAAHGVSVDMELYEGATHADTIAAFSVFERKRMPELARVIDFIHRIAGSK